MLLLGSARDFIEAKQIFEDIYSASDGMNVEINVAYTYNIICCIQISQRNDGICVEVVLRAVNEDNIQRRIF